MELDALNETIRQSDLRVVEVDESANPPIEANRIPYGWQDLHHPMLAQMVEEYRLQEVIGEAESEFEQLLHLRHWVWRNIPAGTPEWDPDHPWLLADLARNGRPFYCTHYSLVLMYAATALGWPARHVGIDCDHEQGQRSTHHGVCDVFCYELDKWVVLDAMFDVHYEHDGVPLNALEIRNTFLRSGPDAIDKALGPQRRRVASSGKRTPPGYDESACYFWFLINSRSDYFTQPAWQGNERLILYVDEFNKDKTWYQNEKDEAGEIIPGSRLHSGYTSGRFWETDRVADCFPPLGQTHIAFDLSAPRPADKSVLPVVLYAINPYWHGFEVRFDEAGPWVPVARRVDWPLHAGRNVLEARLVTLPGHRGKPARIEMTARCEAA